MRLFIALLVISTPLFAQQPARILRAACGPRKSHFDVVMNPSNHFLQAPPEGKARIYFVQDLGSNNPFGAGGTFITDIGIDGAWAGAEKNKSWFSVVLAPGTHHICARAQSHLFSPVTELAHFTAEANHVYYFRVRNLMWNGRRLDFGRVDSDEAKYMIYTSAQSKGTVTK